MNATPRKTTSPSMPLRRDKPDRVVIHNELLMLAGFAALFALAMVVTAWGSGMLHGI